MTTYIPGSCHCGLNSFRVAFKTDSLPIRDDLCHCSTCKHTSGQLAVHHVSIVGVPLKLVHELGSRSASRNAFREEHNHRGFGNGHLEFDKSTLWAPTPHFAIIEPEVPFDLTDLATYETHSPDVTRYFCRSCSAQLFWVRRKSSEEVSWAVAAGALERTEGVVELGYHIWVGDTFDGGLANHLRFIDGVTLNRFKEGPGSEELPLGWNTVQSHDHQSHDHQSHDHHSGIGRDLLPAYCHCGAINFAITRPSEDSFNPSAPYPDLLYPHNTTHLAKISNMKDDKWWLRPENSMLPSKYLAGHCMCSFCRLTSGFEVQSWAFIPLVNIVKHHTLEPISLDVGEGRRPAGLTQYLTSPGRYREFCGTCGATVFSWAVDCPDIISVSVGLFDEKVGARAEEWLDWQKNRVAFQEKALSRSIANGLHDTLKNLARCPPSLESEKRRRVEVYEEAALTESPPAGVVVEV